MPTLLEVVSVPQIHYMLAILYMGRRMPMLLETVLVQFTCLALSGVLVLMRYCAKFQLQLASLFLMLWISGYE